MRETTIRERTVGTVQGGAREYRRLAGLAFVGLGAGFLTTVMVAAAMVPGYDFRGGAISDLGVAPETALLFNTLLVLAGVVNIAGGYLLYRAHGERWLLGLFVVAGAGAVVAGVFPLDTGAPHSLGALLAFVFFNLEAIGVGTRLRGTIRGLSLVAGGLGLAFVVLMMLGDAGTVGFGPLGHGGAERLIVYPVMLWLLVLGGYLLGTTARPDGSAA
jgi:hypothetical membrane protein